MKKWLKKIFRMLVYLLFLVIASGIVTNYAVKRKTKDKLYDEIGNIPKNKVGLLLGTSKYLRIGEINLYYKYRVEAAVKLYNAGRIDFILISGDNGSVRYDEPTTMKKDLIKQGVPESKIYLDYAGFRTLDSVVRSKEIFGQESITIISQAFHNERAVFIAKAKGINAIGFNAKDVDVYYGVATRFREKFARGKMVLDLVFNKKPKFLGEKIVIK